MKNTELTINAVELAQFQDDERKLLCLGEFSSSTIESLTKEMEELGFVLYDPWDLPDRISGLEGILYDQTIQLKNLLKDHEKNLELCKEENNPELISAYQYLLINIKKMILVSEMHLCKFNTFNNTPTEVLKEINIYTDLLTMNIEMCNLTISDILKKEAI